MVAVGDDHLPGGRIAHQQEGRQLFAVSDLQPVLLDVRIAAARNDSP
jgi:hypothetical protein